MARRAHGLAERRRERGGPEPPRNTDMEVEGDASGVPTEGRGVSSGTSTGGSAARSVGQGERDWLILNAPFLHAPAPAGERSTTRESAAAAPSVGACSGGANGGLPSGRRGPPAPTQGSGGRATGWDPTNPGRGAQEILAGVRFAALSGSGPSGMRPEHLKEQLAVRRRSSANRLLRAVGALEQAAAAGSLPPTSRWILASRLVFLRKKVGPAPRPIRVGEVWRGIVGKWLMHRHEERLRPIMVEARQFGVGVPGGGGGLGAFPRSRRGGTAGGRSQ